MEKARRSGRRPRRAKRVEAAAPHEILNLFYTASLCLARFESPQKSLPDLFKILHPIIPIQAAVLFEQRHQAQDAFVAKEAAFTSLDDESIRAYAARSLSHLSGQVRSYGSSETSRDLFSPFEEAGIRHTITLPLFVDRQPIFGILQLGCRHMNERKLSILHAIGNQLALALDRHYQRELRTKHFMQEQAALAAVKQEAQFRVLADSVPMAVWVVDLSGAVLYANRRWNEYTGLSHEESAGHGWVKALHPDDKKALQKAWRAAIEQRQPYEMEHRLRNTRGEDRWHLSRAVPDKDEKGHVFRWIGTSMDIDDQKRIESELIAAKAKAESANRAKSAFLATMSHEIRTPIGVIMGSADLLQEVDEEKRSLVRMIQRNSEVLLNLVNEILDLTKIEAGYLIVERMDVDVISFFTEIAQTMLFKAQAKGIHFRVSYESPLPGIIRTDPHRLRQILLNIVGNAIKFTAQGEVSLTIRMVPHSKLLECVVKDSGIGLSLDEQSRIWEAFVQADASTTRKHGGTGLGLTLSQRLARALGGDVVLVESSPGVGSVFHIRIDTDASWEDIKVQKAQIASEKTASGGTLEARPKSLIGSKVLVVEDAPDNQYILQKYLEHEGAEVDFASNGREGIRSATQGSYDIVLMDIQMPGVDGFEAAETLRNQNYQRPIIAISAHALKSEQEKAEQAGFNAYLVKPVDRKLLIQMIADYVLKNGKRRRNLHH